MDLKLGKCGDGWREVGRGLVRTRTAGPAEASAAGRRLTRFGSAAGRGLVRARTAAASRRKLGRQGAIALVVCYESLKFQCFMRFVQLNRRQARRKSPISGARPALSRVCACCPLAGRRPNGGRVPFVSAPKGPHQGHASAWPRACERVRACVRVRTRARVTRTRAFGLTARAFLVSPLLRKRETKNALAWPRARVRACVCACVRVGMRPVAVRLRGGAGVPPGPKTPPFAYNALGALEHPSYIIGSKKGESKDLLIALPSSPKKFRAAVGIGKISRRVWDGTRHGILTDGYRSKAYSLNKKGWYGFGSMAKDLQKRTRLRSRKGDCSAWDGGDGQ